MHVGLITPQETFDSSATQLSTFDKYKCAVPLKRFIMSVLKAMLKILSEAEGQDVKIKSKGEKIMAAHIEDDLDAAGIKYDAISVDARYQGRVEKHDVARFQVFGDVTEEDIEAALGGDYDVEFE